MVRRAAFIALLCAAGSAIALNVNDPRRFECKQGNCINGPGIAWDAMLNVNMQGNWSNGNTIPGATYTITLPIAPTKQFKQIYGQDGMLDSGDQPRSIGAVFGVVPSFRGSYGRITHAFLRQQVAVIKQGVYDTGLGIEFRGRFEYLAAKSGMTTGWGSGFYIFYGDKVDTEENEKETGLFISDETPGAAPVRFVKADPSYLAVMQKKYQRDMELAQGDFKQQESEQGWRTALSIVGNVALTLAAGNNELSGRGNALTSNLLNMAGGGVPVGALSSSGSSGVNNLAGDITMNLVSSMFNSAGNGGLNVKELASQAIGNAAGNDRQLASALFKAVTDGMEGAGNPAAARPVQANSSTNTATNIASNTTAPTAVSGGSAGALGTLGGSFLKNAMASAPPAEEPKPAVRVVPKAGPSDAPDPKLNARPGRVAQLEKLDPPEGLKFQFGSRLYATNDGVYVSTTGTDKASVVAKRTVGRGSVRGWLTWKLADSGATFSVSSLRQEDPDVFSISWATRSQYGSANMNNNAISLKEENNGAHAFVPFGAKSTWIRQWAIGNGGEVFLQKSGGDGRRDFRGRFDSISDGALSLYKDLAATDEAGTTLYAVASDLRTIVQFTATKQAVPIDLSAFGPGLVNTLIAAHNRLWIGYGDQILTLRDGKLSLFAKMNGVLATHHPTFCMAGTTLYSADGQFRESVNITSNSPRSFLQDSPNLRQEDLMTLAEIKATLNLGMYCADSAGWSPQIYAWGLNLMAGDEAGKQKLFVISPK